MVRENIQLTPIGILMITSMLKEKLVHCGVFRLLLLLMLLQWWSVSVQVGLLVWRLLALLQMLKWHSCEHVYYLV